MMSKVTIKFWDVERREYAPDSLSENLLVNEKGDVFIDVDSGLSYPVGGDFEPHFYKDGKRIA